MQKYAIFLFTSKIEQLICDASKKFKKYIAKLENTKSERNGKKKEIECGNLRIFIPKYDLNFDNVHN